MGTLRSGLQELADVFGCSLAEEAPPAAATPAETTMPVTLAPADPVMNPPTSPDDLFIGAASTALTGLRGRSFQTKSGANLTVVGFKRPHIHRPKKRLDVMVPVVVSYEGKAPPDEWAVADKAMEGEILQVLKANADGPFRGLKFLRRRKSDPFEGEKESLTILRFRA